MSEYGIHGYVIGWIVHAVGRCYGRGYHAYESRHPRRERLWNRLGRWGERALFPLARRLNTNDDPFGAQLVEGGWWG